MSRWLLQTWLSANVNTLRPMQNRRHFRDGIFQCIFLSEDAWIPIKIPLKFVPKGSINNIPTLVQIIAWRRPDDKPLSELMTVSLLTHICVTRPHWVNKARVTQAFDIIALQNTVNWQTYLTLRAWKTSSVGRHNTLTHLPPGQNGRRFADDIFRCIFVNEKFCTLIKTSLKFVP